MDLGAARGRGSTSAGRVGTGSPLLSLQPVCRETSVCLAGDPLSCSPSPAGAVSWAWGGFAAARESTTACN